MKFFCFAFIASLVFIFSLSPVAQGGTPDNSDGSGPPSGYNITGVSGGSGTAYWKEIVYPNSGPHFGVTPQLKQRLASLKLKFTIPVAQKNLTLSQRNSATRDATRAILNNLCNKPKTEKMKKCPYWRVVEKGTNTGSVSTWYKIHPLKRGLWKNGTRPSENIPVAFNIRVWRENPKNGKFSLIFRRSLGKPTEKTNFPKNLGPIQRGSKNTTAPVWPQVSAFSNRWANTQWWDGFSAPYWAKTGRLGGAISYPNPSGTNTCQDNVLGRRDVNGARGVSGSIVKAGASTPRVKPDGFNPYLAAKRGILKRGQSWCYWEGADFGEFGWKRASGSRQFGNGIGSGRGLKESLFIKWDFNDYKPRGGRYKFGYKFEGAPGYFYIIHLAAVDSRQNLMPLKGAGGSFTKNNQIIRAFVSRGINTPEPQGCSNNPSGCYFQSEPPSIYTEVVSETPIQTRQRSDQKVLIASKTDLDTSQSVLPHSIGLSHYTPQLTFSLKKNEGTGSTYPSNYVSYGSDLVKKKRLGLPGQNSNIINSWENAYFPSQSVLEKLEIKEGDTLLQQSVLDSPADLKLIPVSEQGEDLSQLVGGEIISEKTYNITWNQPTLDNPCAFQGSLVANRYIWFGGQEPGWPANLDECKFPGQPESSEDASDPNTPYYYREYPSNLGVPIRNVWDDVLSATSRSEVLYVAGTKNPNKQPFNRRGFVSKHPLRCGSSFARMANSFPFGGSSYLLNSDSVPQSEDTVPSEYSQYYYNSTACNNTYIPFVNDGGPNQRAQSTVLLAGRSVNNPRAALNIDFSVLNGSASDLKIYPREDPDSTVEISSLSNLSGGIHLCLQGLPKNSFYQAPNKKIQKTTNPMLGDPECRGFALKWSWNTDWESGTCQKEAPSPEETREANLASISLAKYPGSIKYGQYTENSTYKGVLRPGTAPFIGKYPTQKGASLPCKNDDGESVGYATKGSWKIGVGSQPGWGPGNNGPRINIPSYTGAGEGSGVFVIDFQLNGPENESFYPDKCSYSSPNPSNPTEQIINYKSNMCWSVQASYTGFPEYIWASKWKDTREWVPDISSYTEDTNCGDKQINQGQQQTCTNDFTSPPNFAYIKVFGSRSSR